MSRGPITPPTDDLTRSRSASEPRPASPAAEPGQDPPPASRRTRSWRQRGIVGVGALVVLGLLAAACAVAYGWYRFSQIDRQDLSLAEAQGGITTYLIVGSDSRDVVSKRDADAGAFLDGQPEGGGQRSDTVMIARVDADAGTIDLLSLPRDLWIPISGTDGRERLNSAYSLGGAQRLIDTLEMDFAIPINHYVEVDFKTFKGVVGAVDGVPMYFDRPMRDTNSGLYIDQPGCVRLDGDQALAFARARHLEYRDDKGRWQDDPTGDLGRITRQQTFVRRVIDRAQARTRSLDLRATNDLLGSTVENLSVDQGLDVRGLLGLARQFHDFTGDSLHTYSLPVVPYTTAGGAAVLRLDDSGAQDVLNVFRGLPEGSFPPSAIRTAVVDGSGVAGRAAKVGDALTSLGVQLDGDPTTAKGVDKTVVRYAPGSERPATELARYLDGPAQVREDAALSNGKIVLTIGRDFTTVRTDPKPSEQVVATSGTTVPAGASSPTAHSSSTSSTTTAPVAVDEPVGITTGDPPDGVSCS